NDSRTHAIRHCYKKMVNEKERKDMRDRLASSDKTCQRIDKKIRNLPELSDDIILKYAKSKHENGIFENLYKLKDRTDL
ncbi:5794_t:CDS:2, partial [Racocetra persica]